MVMNYTELRNKWPDIKPKIQQQHPELSEEDLLLEIGKEAELLQRLQARLRKNREEIFNWLAVMG